MSEDWYRVTTDGRRTRIVSPDPTATRRETIRQDNRFAALDNSSTDSDLTEGISELQSALAIEDTGRIDYASAYTDRSIDITAIYLIPAPQQQTDENPEDSTSTSTANLTDTEDDDSIFSMTSDTASIPLGNLISDMKTLQADLTPITKDRNYAQVVIFREAMGSTLARYSDSKHDSGFSWLVDTTTTYQERLGNATATLPKKPTRPIEPADETKNKSEWYKNARDLKHYKECNHWENQILTAIELKFPRSLEAKKNRFGGFPLTFTSQEAIELVANTVNKKISRRQAHSDIQLTMLQEEFNFTSDDSTIEYLKEMEQYKRYMDILGCGGMPYDNLITQCMTAFRNSHIPSDKTRTIETRWNKIEHDNESILIDEATTWDRFKLHYIDEINNLKEDGLLSAGKANRITEERLSDLETRFTQHDYDLELMNETQSVHDKAFQSIGKGGVPELIGSLGSPSALSATQNSQQITELVNKAFEARMADYHRQQGTKFEQARRPATPARRPATPSTKTTAEWRSWDKWCYTHGANLRHKSPDCDHPRDGHKNEATKTNPMGGNTKRDHLWGKWCSPVDRKVYDNPT